MALTRRHFLISLAVVPASAGMAFAQASPDDQVMAQLVAQGFSITSVRRTLLGRVQIIAARADQTREIVIDPRNGVILRDYLFTNEAGTSSSSTTRQSGRSGNSYDDDDDDDDDGDDDGDDDDDDDDDGDDDEDD